MSDSEPPNAPAPLTAGRVGVYIECLEHGQNLPLPAYHSEGAAGMDLYAAVTTPITLHPGERALIATGICIAVPPGYEAQIRARSGNALYRGLGMVNAPGTIDSDYRGEIKAILINWGQEPQTIRHGDRIAQLVIAPVARAEWIAVETLTQAEEHLDTERGSGGFGHTGT